MPLPDVPIIGQSISVSTWFPTVQMTCLCEKRTAILIVGESAAVCPSCQRAYIIGAVDYERGKPPRISIGLARKPASVS